MNREKLEEMTGKELVAYADKLGVKVNANKERTGLKESKKTAIDKIIKYEEEHKHIEKKEEKKEANKSEKSNLCYDELVEFLKLNNIEFKIGTKKNMLYAKLSTSIKIRCIKNGYVCYKSGKCDNGTYEEKSKRTKFIITSLADIISL